MLCNVLFCAISFCRLSSAGWIQTESPECVCESKAARQEVWSNQELWKWVTGTHDGKAGVTSHQLDWEGSAQVILLFEVFTKKHHNALLYFRYCPLYRFMLKAQNVESISASVLDRSGGDPVWWVCWMMGLSYVDYWNLFSSNSSKFCSVLTEEVIGWWIKLHNEKFHGLYPLFNFKLSLVRWVGRVASLGTLDLPTKYQS